MHFANVSCNITNLSRSIEEIDFTSLHFKKDLIEHWTHLMVNNASDIVCTNATDRPTSWTFAIELHFYVSDMLMMLLSQKNPLKVVRWRKFIDRYKILFLEKEIASQLADQSAFLSDTYTKVITFVTHR